MSEIDKDEYVVVCVTEEMRHIPSSALRMCSECSRKVWVAPSSVEAIDAFKAKGESCRIVCLSCVSCVISRIPKESAKISVLPKAMEELEDYLESYGNN